MNNFTRPRPPVNSIVLFGIVLDPTDLLLYILAFFVPPFPVLIRKGVKSTEFWASVVLSIMFHLPGLLLALYVIYDTSVITGSESGLQSRFARDNYQQIDDEAIESENNNENTITNNNPNNDSIISPIPQHQTKFNYEEIYANSPIQNSKPSSSSGLDQKEGSNKFQKQTIGNLYQDEPSNGNSQNLPPTYDDVMGPGASKKPAGDFKVQIP